MNKDQTRFNFLQRRSEYIAATIFMVLIFTSNVQAAIITSTFDSDADSWEGLLFTNPGVFISNALPGFSHLGSGGNPGGYIATTDPGPNQAARLGAPAKFLGDKLTFLDGTLSFDLTIDRSGDIDV